MGRSRARVRGPAAATTTRHQLYVLELQAAMIAQGTGTHGASVSVGDYLKPETGNMVGPRSRESMTCAAATRAARR